MCVNHFSLSEVLFKKTNLAQTDIEAQTTLKVPKRFNHKKHFAQYIGKQ